MSLQILLVDDEPAIKIGFRQLTDWSKTPYTLCGTAGNGKEALAYLEKNPVDIIITDLKMSVMDGIGLIHALKQNNSEIPIIVLSSYSDFELVREALTAGAADYILKANISADSLIAHLDKVAGNLLNRQKDRAAALLQKQQLEEQNTQILMNDIRNFFLDETITTEELLKETSDLAFFSVPCIVLTLFFHEDMKREKLKRVAPNIQTLLTETLALAASPVSIMMHHNELAFFLPYSDTLKYNISSKTQVLNRQIATYFGVLPILCYSAPVAGAAECRNAYFSCINARRITFYEKNRSIIFTKDIRFVFEISAEEIQETMNSVLNFVQTGSRENLFGYVRNLLAEWSALPLEPFHLCMNCVHIFEGVALSGKSGKLHAQIHDYQKKISQSTSLAELKVTLCDALLLLLESNENNYENYKKEIQVVMRYVNVHYKEHITLDQIAEEANLNKSYLCRLFKKEYGDSVFNYLNMIRMEKAAELLRSNPGLYVQEAAAEVGITEPFYFTRRFKEYFGISPREYILRVSDNDHSPEAYPFFLCPCTIKKPAHCDLTHLCAGFPFLYLL